MKFIAVISFAALIFSCNKTGTKMNSETDCGCGNDSIINVIVDSVGALGYNPTTKQAYIVDSIYYNFLNIYYVCNCEINGITSITDTLQTNETVQVIFSGKVTTRCPDSLFYIPENFPANITIDSLKKLKN